MNNYDKHPIFYACKIVHRIFEFQALQSNSLKGLRFLIAISLAIYVWRLLINLLQNNLAYGATPC